MWGRNRINRKIFMGNKAIKEGGENEIMEEMGF